MRQKMKLYVFLLLVCLFDFVLSKRIRENIYEPLQGISFCFKRANGTHEMGCSSELDGNVGVVHLIVKDSDTQWLIDHGPHEPYIAVMTPKMFNHQNLIALRQSGKVNGIVLLGFNETDPELKPPDQYSDDNVCPNNPSSLYVPQDTAFCSADKEPWNPSGSNILNENWPFPIFMVDNEVTVNFLRNQCFEKFNKPNETTNESRDWPLCAIELQAHMHLAVDTPTCLRRTDLMNPFSPTMVCDKLGDQNVFMLLWSPPEQKSKYLDNKSASFDDKSVIVVSTKLDGVNLFENAEMGAESPSTGIVTLLSTAAILSRELGSRPTDANVKNVLFALFNGEAFDYIGSSRMMYDISIDSFPAKFSNDSDKPPKEQWPLIKNSSIKMVLEVGQVYERNGLFAHVDTELNDSSFVEGLVEAATNFNLNLKSSSEPKKGLPPSSIQAILKEKRDIPGIVVSNYDRQFSGQYYHSIYDNYTRLNYSYSAGSDQKMVKDLAKLSSTLAAYIYKMATGNSGSTDQFNADSTLIFEMLHCYMVTARCKLFKEAGTPDTPPLNGVTPTALPYPQYVGVDRKLTYHGIMTHRLLAYLTAKEVPGDLNAENCSTPANQTIFTYYYFRGNETLNDTCIADKNCTGICMKTTAWLSEAVSPAFLIDGYDYKSARYSAWTESVWKTITGRIFLKASPTLDRGFFALGLIIFIVSLAVVFWIERHASLIFGNKTSESGDEQGLVEPAQL